MKVIIYVEGPSDKLALNELLKPLIEIKLKQGVSINFFETPAGDRKLSLLTKVPVRAVNILINDPSSLVIALPDLYPKNKGFPHNTFSELEHGLIENFKNSLKQKNISINDTLLKRFRVFCFKHDLEALLLAAEESLQDRLGGKPLNIFWKKPVEDQDHNYPPKYVIEDLFKQHGRKYKDTIDAPLILHNISYQIIEERCHQCFRPFVEYLEEIND